jgi:hypothetical protein
MVPIPRFADIDELNAHLLERCLARQTSILRGTHLRQAANDRMKAQKVYPGQA